MSLGVSILLILLLLVILLKAADYVIVVLKKIAREAAVRTFTLAVVLVSLSTSLPEFFVGVNSSLSGVPVLSFGNVIGSSIANLSLVLGVAFLGGTAYIKSDPRLNREFLVAFFAGILPFVFLLDRNLSRLEGVALVVFYIAYTLGLYHGRFFGDKEALRHSEGFWQELLSDLEKGKAVMIQNFGKFVGGVTVILVASHFLVQLIENLASSFNLPLFVVGLFFVSLGTVLPELAIAYRSIEDHEPSLLVGNRLGAVITNSALVLGVVAIISPFSIVQRREYLLSVVTFVILFALFWFFAKIRHKIGRLEAGILLAIYVIFALLEFSGFKLL